MGDYFCLEELTKAAYNRALDHADNYLAQLCTTFDDRIPDGEGDEWERAHITTTTESLVCDLIAGVRAASTLAAAHGPFMQLWGAVTWVDRAVYQDRDIVQLMRDIPEFGEAVGRTILEGAFSTGWIRPCSEGELVATQPVQKTVPPKEARCDSCLEVILEHTWNGLFSPFHLDFPYGSAVQRCYDCVYKRGSKPRFPWREPSNFENDNPRISWETKIS